MVAVAWVVAGWVALCSAAALTACGLDKRAAVHGRARTRERTLLLLALAGGSPGLVMGMAAFRHKTRKPGFLARFAGVVAVQAGAAAWWLGWLG